VTTYPTNDVSVDMSWRGNRQCNAILIVKVRKTKECAAMDVEVNRGELSCSAPSQNSHRSSNYPPQPTSGRHEEVQQLPWAGGVRRR